MRRHRGLPAVLLLSLLVSLYYSVALPLWEAPEEALHLEYVRYLSQERRLPTPVLYGDVPGGAPGGQYYQPPLYYAAAALALGWLDTDPEAVWHRNPRATWPGDPGAWAIALHREDEAWPFAGLTLFAQALRAFSALLGVATVLGCYGVAWVTTHSRRVALFAAALAALTPGLVFASARISNDAAAGALGALCLWASASAARGTGSVGRSSAAASLLAGAATVAKLQAAALTPVALLAAVIGLIRRDGWPTNRGRWLGLIGSTSGLVAAALGPLVLWWLFHARHHARTILERFAERAGVAEGPRHGRLESLLASARAWHTSYWGTFGFDGDLRMDSWVYGALALGTFMAGLGLLIAIARRWPPETDPWALGIAAILLGVVVAPILYWQTISRSYFDANARFTLPAVAAIVLFLAIGWSRLVASFSAVGTVALFVPLLTLTLAAPIVYVRTAHLPIAPARTSLPADHRPLEPIILANGVGLSGTSGLPAAARPGDTLAFSLYWRAERDAPDEFAAFIRLVAADGSQVTRVDNIPGGPIHAFTPPLWQRGEIVRDPRRIDLPATLASGTYDLQLGAYTFPGLGPIRALTNGREVELGTETGTPIWRIVVQ